MNYSFWKSRTFWTLVLAFVINGGNAIVPMISPDGQIVANAILMLLASYFHVDMAKSAGAVN